MRKHRSMERSTRKKTSPKVPFFCPGRTSEEMAQRLMAMLEGTRTTRVQTNRGVVSHLVRNGRRTDLSTMLPSAGLHVTNTNPLATSPMQSFITEGGGIIATAPCHRDERGAVLVRAAARLRGLKELLLHPPALELPSCPAHLFEGVNDTRVSDWLWDFDPF